MALPVILAYAEAERNAKRVAGVGAVAGAAVDDTHKVG